MSTNPLKRIQKLKQEITVEKKNTYEELYGLRENPFPTMALFSPFMDDPRRNGGIYDKTFRSVEEKRFFDLFVKSPSGGKSPSMGFIQLDPQAGGRGNGKSTFLNHLMHRINGKDWSGWAADLEHPSLNVLAVHILPEPRRQKKFWQLVRLIFQTLYEGELLNRIDIDFRASVLLDILGEKDIDQLVQLSSGEVDTILGSFKTLSMFLADRSINVSLFMSKAKQKLETQSKGMLSIQFEQELETTHYSAHELWESWRADGKTESDYAWRNSGVNWFINGLVPLIIAAGYHHLYVLLDEFEKIYIYQNTRDREEFLDSVRQYFFERSSVAQRYEFLSLILTVHPSIQRYLAEVWQRVGLENIAPLNTSATALQSVELGRSTLPKLKHLLVTYLDAFRIEQKHIGTLYPFSEDALDGVIDQGRYYPRATLWYAYTVLTKAANANVKPLITRSYVDSLAETLELPMDEDDNMFVLPDTKATLKEN